MTGGRTRWKLRRAIQIVNQTLNELKVEQHPDKTSIGRIAKGFDFLGYCLTPAGLVPAARTILNCFQRIARLYEQGADLVRIGRYVRNWLAWLHSGVASLWARGDWRHLLRAVESQNIVSKSDSADLRNASSCAHFYCGSQ